MRSKAFTGDCILSLFLCEILVLRLTLFGLTRTMDEVDATMSAVNEQRELANEIAEAISNPLQGDPIDEVRSFLSLFGQPGSLFRQDELKEELAELEQAELNERLMGDHVPVHTPPGARLPAQREMVLLVVASQAVIHIYFPLNSSATSGGGGRRGRTAQAASSRVGHVTCE
jgi:hypothetical protein